MGRKKNRFFWKKPRIWRVRRLWTRKICAIPFLTPQHRAPFPLQPPPPRPRADLSRSSSLPDTHRCHLRASDPAHHRRAPAAPRPRRGHFSFFFFLSSSLSSGTGPCRLPPGPSRPRRARPPRLPRGGVRGSLPAPRRFTTAGGGFAARPLAVRRAGALRELGPAIASARGRGRGPGPGAGAAMVSAAGGPGPGGSRRRSRGPLASGPAAPKPFPGPRNSARPWPGRGAEGPGALGRAGRALPRTGRGGAGGSCLGPGALRGWSAAGLGFPRPPQLGGSRLPWASPSPGPAAVAAPLRSLGAARPKKWRCDRFSPSHAVFDV